MTKKQILFAILLFPLFLNAQVNVLVGYDLGIRKISEINQALSRYNSENIGLTNKMQPINTMNGLDLGLSYKLTFVSLEAHYTTRFKSERAEQKLNDELYKHTVKLNDAGFSFGTILHFGAVGIGAAWEQHKFRFARRFSTDKQNVEAFSPKLKYSTLNFHLNYYLKLNDNLGFHFRPYYQLPLGGDNVNASAVDSNLKLNPTTHESKTTNWGIVGIKFLFANGYQKKMYKERE